MVIASIKKENEMFFNFQKSHSEVTNKMLCCYRPHGKAVTAAEEFPHHRKRNVLLCTCYKLVCVYRFFFDALDKSCSTDAMEEFHFIPPASSTTAHLGNLATRFLVFHSFSKRTSRSTDHPLKYHFNWAKKRF